jgi:ribosomal protein S15P/S13E
VEDKDRYLGAPATERYLGESDWDDIDLLTTDEATVRLDDDINELQKRIAEGPDDAAARTRLDLLVQARERLSTPKKFNFPKA